MSCDASVVVTADADHAEALLRHAIKRLHELEQRWSRFLGTSEITGLNNARGEARRASADTVRLVEALVQAWHATGGAFDPTLLGTLVELGYAASRDDATLRTSLAADARLQGRPDQILVDPATGVIRLPVGTTLDPGGLGKGLAADIVTGELIEAGAGGALIEIGGDVRVAGTPAESEFWAIGVTPAFGTDERRVVDLTDGGVATSTSRLRTWAHGGRRHHHLIDPTTLLPSAHDVVSCTVVAGSTGWAEAFTKVGFAHHPHEALHVFEERSLAASITSADGTHHVTASWKEFVR